MDPWSELFSLDLRHGYCSDVSRCRIRLLPDERTAGWLERAGVLLRSRPDGLQAVHAQRATRRMELPTALHFGLFSDDAAFGVYTDALARHGEPAPRFDSAAAVHDAPSGRDVLLVAVAQCGPMSPRAAGAPQFIVTLRLAAAGQRWRLQLAPRALIWKYVLVGDWAAERPQVVDVAGEVEFEPASSEPLAGDVPALAIRSTSRLPLLERSERRFQLRGRAGNRSRELVKRLPVASATQLGLDHRGGVPTLVSEIFVQRPQQR